MSKAMQERPFKGENDQCIFSEIRSFLNALNSGQGKTLETLSPADARQVLMGAQKSVEVNYSGIVESERRVTQNGLQSQKVQRLELPCSFLFMAIPNG